MGVALGAQPAEGGVDIDGVPENDAVQNDTQRAKLVLSEMILKAGYCSGAVALFTQCDWK
jgi:hypothetical protein